METKGKLFLVTILVSIFISFSSLRGYAKDVRGVTDTTIKIGGILDQTGPVAGDITVPITEGFRNYTRHVNDNGGIFERKIKFIAEDDHYTIPGCIAAFKKLLFRDEIFALFGPANTGGARALFTQIEKLRIPNLSGAPDETQVNPLKKHIFMPFNTYYDQFGVILDYIVNDLKTKKIDVTFVYWDSESGKVALASVQRWAKFFNFSLNNIEIINMGALDATSQVMNIKRNKPTHILIHHGSPGTVALLKDLRKFGLNTPVYGDIITCTEDTVRMGGSTTKNYVGAHLFSSWYDDGKGVEEMRRVTLKYKPGTEMPYRSKMHTLGWIIGTIFNEGLKRAGRDLSIDGFVTAMESIRDMDTGGLSGPISFSPTNHKGIHRTKLYKADPESGKLVPITDWRKTPEIK